jgi:hypothetical protein
MSCGGAHTTKKKMKTGGTTSDSKKCPDGTYWSVQGCIPIAGKHEKMFSTTSSKIGASTLIGGLLTAAGTKIGQKINANQTNKKEAANLMKTLQDANLKKNGGAVKKKYAMGGQTIVGMPIYNASTRPMQMKSGGATKNTKLAAVAAPKNKITRADVLARILKKKKK